jgi:hypothetical protein
MKKLFSSLAIAFAITVPFSAQANFASDPRFPTFQRNGIKFQCTIQPEFGTVTLLFWDGASWLSWGGPPDSNGEVSPSYDDATIMAHGSLRGFLDWMTAECQRRAEAFAALPPPDPTNRAQRLNYALKMLVKVQNVNGVDTIVVPVSPLP